MLKEIRPAIVLILAFTLMTGVVYPFVMTGIARVAFPLSGAGQLGRTRRQSRWISAHWPSSRAIGISMVGPLRRLLPTRIDSTKTIPAPYKRGKFRGIEFGAYQQDADRAGTRRRGKAQSGKSYWFGSN